MAGSEGQPLWKSPFVNQQTLETKTFTWRIRENLFSSANPGVIASTASRSIKSLSLAGTTRQMKPSSTPLLPSASSSNQQQDQFLRFQEFEIEAGQSLGKHSVWSLFIVSCGSSYKSSTSLTAGSSSSDSDYVGLFLRKVLKPSKQQQSMYLNVPNVSDEEIVIQYKIEILDREGEVLYTKECETAARELLEDGCWDWRKIVPVSKFQCCGKSPRSKEPTISLTSVAGDCLLLVRVSFTMVCRRKIGKAKMPALDGIKNDSEEESSAADAAKAFLKLVTTAKSLDPNVIIEITNRRKFMVHKQILTARSPVFLKMLAVDMNEKSGGVVKVDDISGNTMELVLRHIYTGQLEEDWTSNPVTATELIYASEKYWLPALKEFCNNHLVRAATKTNCYRLMEVAQLHNLEKATEDLMAFVSEGISSNGNSRKPSEESIELKT